MTVPNVSKVFRVEPAFLVEREVAGNYSLLTEPSALVRLLKPGIGLVVADWNRITKEGTARRIGIVTSVTMSSAKVQWAPETTTFCPNPSGRQFWEKAQPFFAFNKDVAIRYGLPQSFTKCFPSHTAG